MYFKKIYMHGFKSFAEPVTIEFHPGITCIVGPNGSGKSNISDAIRWVLGEQSPKMLRGGKMQEVIFAGTQSRKSRGMAEVTLTIDNSTGILPIEYNEVAITRRMFRSGESEYYINNNQCRLRDIRELIMDTGIGVDGYSLIGQGKIADIVSNKTESRKEIFEEAAGVVMYRTKKAEAERKMENANGNLDRVNDIIGEIEGRIGGLKEDSEKAQEYLVLRERFKELEINITLKNVESAEEKVKELEEEITQVSASNEQIAEKKQAVDQDVDAKRERISALDDIAEEARERMLELIDEINTIVNRQQLNTERLSGIERERKRITEELADFEDKFDMENENIRNIEKNKAKIDKKYLNAQQTLADKTEKFASGSEEAADALADVDDAKAKVFECHQLASQKRTEAKGLSSLDETLALRMEQIRRELDEGSFEDGGSMDSLILQKEEIEGKASKLSEKADSLEKGIQDAAAEERRLTREIEDVKITLGQVNARKNTIEEMESNYDGYNYGVKFIMKAGLSGIYGTAAELMSVPEGFETAIETSLGAAMQNIICADDNVAKKAVSELKKAKAGRLTFIPLSSIRHGKAGADASREKGFLGYGDEIISFEEKYRPAFEYLLARTVIVDNMDNAIAMSKRNYQGLRFVTLDGDVINVTGSITGGKYKNKTANILERRAEIDQLSKKAEELAGKKKDAEAALSACREKGQELSSKLLSLRTELRAVEMELVSKESEISNVSSAITSANEKKEKLREELSGLEMRIAQSAQMIRDCEKQALEADQKAQEAEESITGLMKIHEEKKKALDALGEEITAARIALSECESEKKGTEGLVKRIRETIDEITDNIDIREEQLERLEKERKAILSEDESGEDAALKTEEKDALQGKIDAASEEKTKINEELGKVLSQKDTFDEEARALQEQLHSADIRKAKLEAQLESMKEKLWENFEISYIQALSFRKEDFVMAKALKENREIKARMNELGDVNIGAIKEYAEVGERYEFLTSQRADILSSMDDLASIIEDMDQTIREKFKETFDQVVDNFKGIFTELFGGGAAQLELDKPDNPPESNIDIIAQPPGKKLQNINLLSGGEKTMTAIALMFAVLKTKPTPFCILDEVEAALDDANIERFAKYLKNFDETQFALVTHQKVTMEHADVLYGVTMPEQGVSRLLSLKLGDDFKLD